ncbi:MAG TPA: alpha/beta hydrolase [Caulobacteraceae bacterium]|nr:alpha/beta hydrolase [Caulobacteraceae bacterium]
MPEFKTIDAGGVAIRVALEGEGPLALMVHGFPESWYSWRHQIGPVAAAGFTACAMDVRGYGGSQKFPEVADYAMQPIVADVRAVAEALSPGRPAVLIGHDWGAPIVYNTALIHPDKFAALATMSVVYTGVPTRSLDDVIKAQFDDKNRFFYQSYFREPGRAEAVFDPNPRDFLRKFYYIISGDAQPAEMASAWVKDASAALLDGMPDPEPFPAWLTETDLDYFVGEFERSGFFGPLSRYRNHTRDFDYLQQFKDRVLSQPACFVAGDKDGAFNGFGALGDPIAAMRAVVPNLESAHVLPGCGHWTQQERPAEVNAALVPWLKTLPGRVI